MTLVTRRTASTGITPPTNPMMQACQGCVSVQEAAEKQNQSQGMITI